MHKNTIIKISHFCLKSWLNGLHAWKHGRFILVFAPPAVQPLVETSGNVSNNDDSGGGNTFLKKTHAVSWFMALILWRSICQMVVNFSEVEFWQTVSFKTEVESPFICLLPCRFAVMQRRQRRNVQKSAKPSRSKVFVLLI